MSYTLHREAVEHWQRNRSSHKPLIEYTEDNSDESDSTLIIGDNDASNGLTVTQNTLPSCFANQNDLTLEPSGNMNFISPSPLAISTHINLSPVDCGKITDQNQSQLKSQFTSKKVVDHSGHIHQKYQYQGDLKTEQLCKAFRRDERNLQLSCLNNSSPNGKNYLKAKNPSFSSRCETTPTSKASKTASRIYKTTRVKKESYSMTGEDSSFKRFFGKLVDLHLKKSSQAVIERRVKNAKTLMLDENIFRDLDGIEDWNLDEPVPSSNQLTAHDIKRVKKGMMNGQLYNIGVDHIRKIFHNLSREEATPANDIFPSRLYRCPLCPRTDKCLYNVHNHIESLHTMSLITCSQCNTVATTRKSSWTHLCSGFSAAFKSTITPKKALTKVGKELPLKRIGGKPNDYLNICSSSIARVFGSLDSPLPTIKINQEN